MDKCNIYDFDYTRLSKLAMEDGRGIEDFVDDVPVSIKNCSEFEFDYKLKFDNSTFQSSIVTDVSENDLIKYRVIQGQEFFFRFLAKKISNIVLTYRMNGHTF